jgi:hypothetical protein
VHVLARQSELLVLAAVAYAVALAAGAVLLGFSEEVGAFLAGMSLASSSYREAISGRLTTLRDFLLVFFFIDLGTRFELSSAADQLLPALLFSLFVLIGNPIIVMVIMGFLGYRKRVSFKAGLTVAQISEFSLILVALGVSLGQVGGEVVGLVTAVGLITISASTYLIYGSDAIYDRIEPLLRVFERKQPDGHHRPRRGPSPAGVRGHRSRPVRAHRPRGAPRPRGRGARRGLRPAQRPGRPLGGPRRLRRRRGPEPARAAPPRAHALGDQHPADRGREPPGAARLRAPRLPRAHRVQREHRGAGGAAPPPGADLTIRPLHVAAGPLLDRIHTRSA